MPYISIDWNDLETDEMLSELENRALTDREKSSLLKLLKSYDWEPDASKWELFLKIKDKYSLLELEELFKEKTEDAPIPKEQLSLPLK